ncbi:MAG: triose-phosphate isomerase [Firmicutes bacterium]|nr:triose-phosphate isomerase [Bacillota bacterium]
MRIPMVIANWKMYKTVSEAVDFFNRFSNEVEDISGVETVICPPFVSLADLSRLLTNTSLILGAQNMHWEKEGAYTGEISPLMLRELGVKYVIIGHSERRNFFGESDRVVRKKVESAFAYGLFPILCIGENWEQFNNGETQQVLKEQLFSALEELNPGREMMSRLVVAYEPVWAIGTGTPATGEAASKVAGYIRELLRKLWGEAAEEIRILYGGSVNPGNILEFTGKPDIDGALIGGSSLKEKLLAEMARAVFHERRG